MISKSSGIIAAVIAIIWIAQAIGVLASRPAGVLLPPVGFYLAYTLLPLLSASAVASLIVARWRGKWAACLAVAAGFASGCILLGVQMRVVVEYVRMQDNPRIAGMLSNFHVTAYQVFDSLLIGLLLAVFAVVIWRRNAW